MIPIRMEEATVGAVQSIVQCLLIYCKRNWKLDHGFREISCSTTCGDLYY